jgi:hypothetical protein
MYVSEPLQLPYIAQLSTGHAHLYCLIQVSLSVWRDEAKGLINGMKPEDLTGDPDAPGIIDLTSDIEPDSSPSRKKQRRSSSPTTDVDMVNVPSGPPSSGTEVDDDDFDIDALVKEEEERLAQMKDNSSAATTSFSPRALAALAPKATYRDAEADDDDEAMWDELNGLGDELISPPPPPLSTGLTPTAPTALPPPLTAPGGDEDMWDVVREMDAGMDVQQPYIPPPPPPHVEEVQVEPEHAPSTAAGAESANGNGDSVGGTNTVEQVKEKELVEEGKGTRPTNDDDWEDMYL